MASRCIFGSQATGLRPCGWFPLGSLSKVWLCLCDIFIALVGVCADDINSDGIKVHFGFPGNWFGTLRMIPTGIAKQSVMVSLRYCYRFGWCLPWRHQEWWRQGAFWVSWQLVCDLAGDSHEDRQAKCDGLFAILLSLWLVSSLTSVSDGVKVHFGFPGQTQQQWIQPVAGNPARWRFTSETTQEREKRLEIQHEQWIRRRQLETEEQREHRLTQRRQGCPQEQRNRSLEYQGQYQGLPSVIKKERLHFRSQNISLRHGCCRSGITESVF